MRPIKTYAVRVDGYDDVLYSARSPGKARMRCYRDYTVISTKSFGEFLSISTIRVVPDPPGAGERILVEGRPATRCLPVGLSDVFFMRDDGDVVLKSHPLDVSPMSPAPASAGGRP